MYTEKDEREFTCMGHAYGDWVVIGELHNDVDAWQRVCQHCGKPDTHIGHMPPPDWQQPKKTLTVLNPLPEMKLKNKMQFLVDLAAKLVRQNPGMPVVYIAGKVSKLPPREVKQKFGKAKLSLELKGYLVLNPIDFIEPTEDWHTAMRMATTLLMMAEHIYLLHDWQDSKGARVEFEMATQFGISVISVE